MEIKKVKKHEPSYPGTALKVGAAVAAAGLLIGCMTGCREKTNGGLDYVGGLQSCVEVDELAGEAIEHVPDDEIELSGLMAEQIPEDEGISELDGDVACVVEDDCADCE